MEYRHVRTFIVFSGDTRARTRVRADPRALCAREETTVYEL